MATIIRIKELEKKLAMRSSSIYALIKRGEFPQPVQLTNDRVSGWLDTEVDAWLESRPRGVRGWGARKKVAA
ncbi:MAG: AlpA family phage regulatory protein [Gallionella sp.]